MVKRKQREQPEKVPLKRKALLEKLRRRVVATVGLWPDTQESAIGREQGDRGKRGDRG